MCAQIYVQVLKFVSDTAAGFRLPGVGPTVGWWPFAEKYIVTACGNDINQFWNEYTFTILLVTDLLTYFIWEIVEPAN